MTPTPLHGALFVAGMFSGALLYSVLQIGIELRRIRRILERE